MWFGVPIALMVRVFHYERGCVMGFPRKVLVSPGFGAGFATWADSGVGYDIAECPELICYVEQGGRDENEARQILVTQGVVGADDYVCWGGFSQVVVVTVDGPYRLTEYDGSESVEVLSEVGWRF